MVIDACFSGNSAGGDLITGTSNLSISPKKVDRSRLQGRTGSTDFRLFTATSQDELAVWDEEEEHSLFSWAFMKGLQGAADANDDSRITVGELQDYLEQVVPERALRLKNLEQRPSVSATDTSAELVRY